MLSHARSLDPSNRRACVMRETCRGCGLCTRRCPMDAPRLEEAQGAAVNRTGKVAVRDEKLCIGRGICAYKCPSGSVRLKRHEITIDLPLTVYDYAIERLRGQWAALRAPRNGWSEGAAKPRRKGGRGRYLARRVPEPSL